MGKINAAAPGQPDAEEADARSAHRLASGARQNCGCRAITGKLKEEFERRGIASRAARKSG